MCLGGYFHGRDKLTYGVDVATVRVMGVLQVLCLAFTCVAFICFRVLFK